MSREYQSRPFGGAQPAGKDGPNKQYSGLAVDVLVPCFKRGAVIGRIVSNCLNVLPEAIMFVYDNNPSDSAEDEAAKENVWLVFGGQFVRFAIVGTLGFLVDASMLYLCLHLTGLGLYGGRLVSYLVSATTTWYFNHKFTFTNSDSASPMRQWARFVFANGFGGLINYGTYSFVVSYWGTVPLAPLIGVAAGSIIGLGVNFTASRFFVFKERLPGSAVSTEQSLQVWRLLSIPKYTGDANG